MKKSITLLAFAAMLSCADKSQDSEPTYALLSGTISNTEATVAVVSGPDFEKKISVDPRTGKFSDTLYLPKSGFYQFSSGEYSTVYLENGYELNMTVDAKKFDESMAYTGVGSEVNNYLATKFMDNETIKGPLQEFYALNEEDYKGKIEEIKSKHISNLSKLENVDADFVANEKQNLTYEAYVLYNKYENYHKSVTNDPEFKVSDDFLPEELSSIEYNDPKLYATSTGYQELARGATLDDVFESIGANFQNASPTELASISDIAIPDLKNEIISNYGSMFISPGNPNMEANYNFLAGETTSDKIKESLGVSYERGLKLKPGQPSPEFVNYENHKGGETSLADLRGSYVYIDVWATWCGPCIREIPSLKEIEAKYHDRNIKFVSTSIDRAKDHDTWVAMVTDKQLGGTQLMADNDWQSKFVKDYGIEGIPRFILIDPDGNIVSADAPRPSNPQLVEMFEELKI